MGCSSAHRRLSVREGLRQEWSHLLIEERAQQVPRQLQQPGRAADLFLPPGRTIQIQALR